MKRTLKFTKLEEFEIEMKLYVDECTRLKHMLEEVMRQKDPFSDPEQVARIEQQFQMQNTLLEEVQNENKQLAQACVMMENDIGQYKMKLEKLQVAKKKNKVLVSGKKKLLKSLKDRDRELVKLRKEMNVFHDENQQEKDTMNLKVMDLNQKVSDLQSELDGKTTNQRAVKREIEDKDTKIATLEAELERVKGLLTQKPTTQQSQPAPTTTAVSANVDLAHDLKSDSDLLADPIEESRDEMKSETVLSESKPVEQKRNQPQVKKYRIEQKTINPLLNHLKLVIQASHNSSLTGFLPDQDEVTQDEFEKHLENLNFRTSNEREWFARFLFEPKDGESIIIVDGSRLLQKETLTDELSSLIGKIANFKDRDEMLARFRELAGKNRETLKEAFSLEDYDEEGYISVEGFKGAMETFEDVPNDIQELILFEMYKESKNPEQLKYQIILDLLADQKPVEETPVAEDKPVIIPEDEQSDSEEVFKGEPDSPDSPDLPKPAPEETREEQATEEERAPAPAEVDQAPVEPESFDNVEKKKDITRTPSNISNNDPEPRSESMRQTESKEATPKKAPSSEGGEQLRSLSDLDKEDVEVDQPAAPIDQSPKIEDESLEEKPVGANITEEPEKPTMGLVDIGNEENEDNEGEDGKFGEGEEDEEIDDEEMIDIAEGCLIKIAEALLAANVSIKVLYKDEIMTETIEGQQFELLMPMSFLEGLRALDLNDFSELEIACLMNILAKPQLENAILVEELVSIMENFGIVEGQMEGNPETLNSSLNESQSRDASQSPPDGSKKRKGLDFSQVGPGEVFLIRELAEYLKLNKISLTQFLGESVFQQQVKTKTKQSTVEIIQADDLFDLIYSIQIVPKLPEPDQIQLEDNVKVFLCLDQAYLDMILLKKLTKAINEVSEREDLQALAEQFKQAVF